MKASLSSASGQQQHTALHPCRSVLAGVRMCIKEQTALHRHERQVVQQADWRTAFTACFAVLWTVWHGWNGWGRRETCPSPGCALTHTRMHT